MKLRVANPRQCVRLQEFAVTERYQQLRDHCGHPPAGLGLTAAPQAFAPALPEPVPAPLAVPRYKKLRAALWSLPDDQAARSAVEHALGQGQLGFHCAAARADLRRRIPSAGQNQPTAVPCGLVGEHAPRSAESLVGDSAGQLVVASHPGHARPRSAPCTAPVPNSRQTGLPRMRAQHPFLRWGWIQEEPVRLTDFHRCHVPAVAARTDILSAASGRSAAEWVTVKARQCSPGYLRLIACGAPG